MSTQTNFPYTSHEDLLQSETIAGRPLEDLITEIQSTYLADKRPWIVGFSGGKDSTTVLSLVYSALLRLSPEERHKPVYVISSNTLVETPVIVDLIKTVLNLINERGRAAQLPISAHSVYPEMDETFWVNLLGRGYPAPKQTFRWCTERMKIDPVSRFITEKVAQFGAVIVLLGSRSQESASRAKVIAKHSINGSVLSLHSTLPNAYTYMPIEPWSADEVWEYLLVAPCPWGGDNRELFELYKGSNQGECPLVIDKSTPSCGNSRFGCWTCTVVTKDRALHGLIESGDEWMRPLLEFRNKLYQSNQPENAAQYRNIKRRTGRVTYMRARGDETKNLEIKQVRGPYWMKWRQAWLKELLELQKTLSEAGHPFPLIREEELQAIRQQWLRDPNEPDILDSLPRIYKEVYGDQIEWVENDAGGFTTPDALLLKELGGRHQVASEMIMKLIEAELSVSGLGRRRGIMNKLESVLRQDWDIEDALNYRNLQFNAGLAWKEKINNLQESIDTATIALNSLDEVSRV